MFESLSELREASVALAGRFEPGTLSADDAAVAVADAATIENVASTIKALAAARLAATDRWRATGDASPEEWLARQTGTSKSQAQAAIRTGNRLEQQPEVGSAARAGTLSAGQAAEISEAAASDPAAEHRLVQLARSKASVGELRDECRRTRAAADPDPDATARRIHRNRSLREFTDTEGAWNLQLRDTVENGATARAALQPFIEQAFADARKAGRHESHEAYAADAFIELCRRSLAAGRQPSPAAEPHDGASTAPKPPPYLGILRLDIAALQRGSAEGDEVVEIAGLGPVPVATARELLGDAVLKLVLTRGVDVANVTHLGRGPTVAQKVALLWTSPICEALGCSRTRRLENDHRTPWTADRVTELHNLDRLCGHHHHKKTHEGWSLVDGKGKRPMVPLDDPRHPHHRSAGGARGQPPPDEGLERPGDPAPGDDEARRVARTAEGRAGPPAPGDADGVADGNAGTAYADQPQLDLGRPDAA
ncbi:MAG TPA: DUF222 domain-containing protein [Acidimicrobiales bacterium]|nr:DUF222 domain-containing protein [Acidimicrobiales bacterium]